MPCVRKTEENSLSREFYLFFFFMFFFWTLFSSPMISLQDIHIDLRLYFCTFSNSFLFFFFFVSVCRVFFRSLLFFLFRSFFDPDFDVESLTQIFHDDETLTDRKKFNYINSLFLSMFSPWFFQFHFSFRINSKSEKFVWWNYILEIDVRAWQGKASDRWEGGSSWRKNRKALAVKRFWFGIHIVKGGPSSGYNTCALCALLCDCCVM